MHNLKNYNNEQIWNSYLLGVIWNSLNLTWTKYFINFRHFENYSNYYPNNRIHLKVFKLPQNILSSKHTLKVLKSTRHKTTLNKLRYWTTFCLYDVWWEVVYFDILYNLYLGQKIMLYIRNYLLSRLKFALWISICSDLTWFLNSLSGSLSAYPMNLTGFWIVTITKLSTLTRIWITLAHLGNCSN